LAKNNLTTEEISSFLLATNNEGNTVWHTAVKWSRTAAVKEIWDFAKEYLTREEINNLIFS
jgi:hypothetical protein